VVRTANTQISPKPYGAFLLFEASTPSTHKIHRELADEVLKCIIEKLESAGGKVSRSQSLPLQTYSGVILVGHYFVSKVPPTWESNLRNSVHELVLVGAQSNQIAVYTSNSDYRRTVLSKVGNPASLSPYPNLSALGKVNSARLTSAFLQSGPLNAMWLVGTHKSVHVKPDSKILSGKDLALALDPLGDSTYLASAARSRAVGVSLRGSGIWTTSCRSMDDFALRVSDAFSKIRSSRGTAWRLPVLANEIDSFSGVADPFDFEVAPVEFVEGVANKRLAIDLHHSVGFRLANYAGASTSPSCFGLEIEILAPQPRTTTTTQVEIEPKIDAPLGSVIFDFDDPTPMPADPILSMALGTLRTSPDLFRVFFNTGHTISSGVLALSIPKDRDFTNWRWINFTKNGLVGSLAVKVSKEKPEQNDLTKIWTDPNEDSLFSWFVDAVSNAPSAAALDLKPLNSNGEDVWLFCDDDAGEVADFVHVYCPATGAPEIALVHMKGASTSGNRHMVAGPFEVVCGQAAKNLRYLDAGTLVDKIVERIHDAKRPLWNVPHQQNIPPDGDRDRFENVLHSIGAETTYRVIVVQPQVRKAEFLLPENQPSATNPRLGAVQLRTLLFSVQAAAHSVGATFLVTGAN